MTVRDDRSHLSRNFHPYTDWYRVRDPQTGHRFSLQLADPDHPPEGLEVLRDEPALDRNGRPLPAKTKVQVQPSRKASTSPKPSRVADNTRTGVDQAAEAETSTTEAKEADQS